MGEIAEDFYDGTCCDICGCYFKDPDEEGYLYTHGHPATCEQCWEDLTTEEKKIHQKAIVETI